MPNDELVVAGGIISPVLTTPEACQYLKISQQTLLRWARKERINSVLIGRSRRWERTELDRLIKRRSKQMR